MKSFLPLLGLIRSFIDETPNNSDSHGRFSAESQSLFVRFVMLSVIGQNKGVM